MEESSKTQLRVGRVVVLLFKYYKLQNIDLKSSELSVFEIIFVFILENIVKYGRICFNLLRYAKEERCWDGNNVF